MEGCTAIRSRFIGRLSAPKAILRDFIATLSNEMTSSSTQGARINLSRLRGHRPLAKSVASCFASLNKKVKEGDFFSLQTEFIHRDGRGEARSGVLRGVVGRAGFAFLRRQHGRPVDRSLLMGFPRSEFRRGEGLALGIFDSLETIAEEL